MKLNQSAELEISASIHTKIEQTENPRKVAMFNPPKGLYAGKVRRPTPGMQPLGLAYVVAATLEAGHDVAVCDAYSFSYGEKEIRDFLIKEQPDVVATTATTPYIYDAWAIHRIAKELNSKVLTVNGGPHASHMPEEVVEDKNTDLAVVGEGEFIFPEILESMDAWDFTNIQGIAYRSDDGEIVRNPNRIFNYHLDYLPFPALKLFPSPYDYSIAPHWGTKGRFAPINTTRGCPYNCEFCSITVYQGKKYRARSVENVILELKMLKESGVSMVSFREGVATLKNNRMKELCRRMIEEKLDISWSCTGTISSANPEMFRPALLRWQSGNHITT